MSSSQDTGREVVGQLEDPGGNQRFGRVDPDEKEQVAGFCQEVPNGSSSIGQNPVQHSSFLSGQWSGSSLNPQLSYGSCRLESNTERKDSVNTWENDRGTSGKFDPMEYEIGSNYWNTWPSEPSEEQESSTSGVAEESYEGEPYLTCQCQCPERYGHEWENSYCPITVFFGEISKHHPPEIFEAAKSLVSEYLTYDQLYKEWVLAPEFTFEEEEPYV